MANKYITTLLLFVLTVFPAGVTIAFTYFSSAHPVESHELENDAFLNDSENKLEILFFGMWAAMMSVLQHLPESATYSKHRNSKRCQ